MSGYNNTISAALRNQSRYYYSRVNAWLFRSYSQPVAITPIFNAILIRKKICNSALMRDANANRYNRRILSRVSSVRDHASLRVHRELMFTRSSSRAICSPSFIDPCGFPGSSHQRVNYLARLSSDIEH